MEKWLGRGLSDFSNPPTLQKYLNYLICPHHLLWLLPVSWLSVRKFTCKIKCKATWTVLQYLRYLQKYFTFPLKDKLSQRPQGKKADFRKGLVHFIKQEGYTYGSGRSLNLSITFNLSMAVPFPGNNGTLIESDAESSFLLWNESPLLECKAPCCNLASWREKHL